MEFVTGITRRFLLLSFIKVHYNEVHDTTSFVYTTPLYKHSYLAAVRWDGERRSDLIRSRI